jgi:antitoxin component of RelBE/YafQ-DinJ toxin-antitoxin module
MENEVCMNSVYTMKSLLTLKIDEKVKEEFRTAAALRGATMSSLVIQFIYRTIREEKEIAPKAFEPRSDALSQRPATIPKTTIHLTDTAQPRRKQGGNK